MNTSSFFTKETVIALASLFVALVTLLINYLAWRYPKQTIQTSSTPEDRPKRIFFKTPLPIPIFFLGFGLVLLLNNKSTTPSGVAPTKQTTSPNTPADDSSTSNSTKPKEESYTYTMQAKQTQNQNNSSRFIKTECSSIKDQRTGYEWFVGPDKNMSYDEAKKWVASLHSCGKTWTLPSPKEVRTLYDPEKTAGIGTLINGNTGPLRLTLFLMISAVAHGYG